MAAKRTSPWAASSRVWAQPPYGTLKTIFPTPNAHLAYEICRGPRHFAGILTDEIGSPWMEVEQGPLVYVQWGHRRRILQLRLHEPYCRRLLAARLQAHPRRPAHDPAGKAKPTCGAALRVGTDLCLSLTWLKWILDNEAYDDLFVRRWTNAPFLWNPRKRWPHEEGLVPGNEGGIDMESRILTEADVDREWISQWWGSRRREVLYRRFYLLGREQQQAHLLGRRGVSVGRREA